MVPNVAKTGTSFKGAALYYLHDKREASETVRLSADRVSWTQTRNLATDNPDLAWRIMAATAMDQDRLKREAGVKNTGRKSNHHVYSYSLAWHPDEAKNLSKAEMLRAADETIRVLGAGGHQALIVCHRDEPHPHVHVVLNRVDPATGRMLGTSNDRVKLSQWSEAYERERGKIWCEQRVANNAKRAKGDFIRATSPTPRPMEQEFAQARSANDNQATRVRDEAKIRAAKLTADSADMRKRHSIEWAVLSKSHKDRKEGIFDRCKQGSAYARDAIKEQFRPAWRDLYRRQFSEQQAFDRRESRLRGKIDNAVQAIKLRRDLDFGNSRGFVAAAFNFITSREARELAMKRQHERQKRELMQEQKRQMDRAWNEVKSSRSRALKTNTDRFSGERTALLGRQADERQQLKERWRLETSIRTRAFDTVGRKASSKQAAQSLDVENPKPNERQEQFQRAAQGQQRGQRLRRRRKRDS